MWVDSPYLFLASMNVRYGERERCAPTAEGMHSELAER